MIDLGDPVVLTFTVTDTSGAPANATSAVVTVTLPDGSTSTPAVTNPQTGTYKATYVTTQAGHHKVSCVATGTNASSQSDVFEVAPLDPGLILGLSQARTAIGQAAATVKDEDLRLYITAAAPIMEDLIGPITSRTCDEWHDGGVMQVKTLYAPLLSVTTVVESYGNFTRTLSAQPLDGAGFDAYGYTVDLTTGLIARRASGQIAAFPPGRQNVHVVYKAGRTTLAGNHLLAARRLIRHLYQSEQQGGRNNMSTPEAPTGYTPSGYAVPRAVIELCADSARIPGIA
ncbi:MAG: hypothetical protein ACXVGQ_00340 [Mycobacteriaceae bacterium]